MRSWFQRAAFVGILLLASVSLAGVQEGVDALDRGDWESAEREFTPLAEAGDAGAMNVLGALYYDGRLSGGPSHALDWWLQAMEFGSRDGTNNLGVLFRDGVGISQRYDVAFALFSAAIDRSGPPDEVAAMRAQKNLRRLNQDISAKDHASAVALIPKIIDAKLIRKLAKGPTRNQKAFIQKVDFQSLGKEYSLSTTADWAKPSLGVVFSASEEQLSPDGGVGVSRGKSENPEGITRGGRAYIPGTDVSIALPPLSSGEVSINQGETRERGVHDRILRFFDKRERFDRPGLSTAGDEQAVLVVTDMPAGSEASPEKLREVIRGMIANDATELSPDAFAIRDLSGSWGPVVELLVPNRVGSIVYPHSKIQRNPARDGLSTLGINRFLTEKNRIIEIGLVVARPAEISEEGFPAYAVKRMDYFMSTLQGSSAK